MKIVTDFGENHEIQKLDQILNPLSERHIAMATLHTFCRRYADKTKEITDKKTQTFLVSEYL